MVLRPASSHSLGGVSLTRRISWLPRSCSLSVSIKTLRSGLPSLGLASTLRVPLSERFEGRLFGSIVNYELGIVDCPGAAFVNLLKLFSKFFSVLAALY